MSSPVRMLTALLLAGCATAGGEPDAGEQLPVDAAGTIDARRFPDASQPADAMLPVDAALPVDAMPDSGGGCTVQTINLLANGNFDSGEVNWTTVSTPDVYPVILSTSSAPDPFPKTPHTGVWGAWAGGADAPFFDTLFQYVHQAVAIPAGATNPVISGQRWMESADSGDFDWASVEIWNLSDQLLQQVFYWNANQKTTLWTAFSAPANNYAGQTVRFVIGGAFDDSLISNWFFDSLAFNVTVCQ